MPPGTLFPKKNPRPSSDRGARAAWLLAAVLSGAIGDAGVAAARAQTPKPAPSEQERGPAKTPLAELRAAIDRLGDLDYAARTKAARLVRRTAPAIAVPALLQAVEDHQDGFVRFRSLILLTGFNDPRAVDQMTAALSSPNDRLREAAYRFFERHPDRALIPRLLTALQKETGEFVRPSLVRALAAVGDEPAVRDALLTDVMRGVDHFRSTVIEALGDYQRAYAAPRLAEVAKLEGPLQDDAVLALGKIGDKTSVPVLASLQRTASRELQPVVAAAICMAGVNCASHLGYIDRMIAFADDNPGYQAHVRAAASGLSAAAIEGQEEALRLLFKHGGPSTDPIRAPLALAVAKVALRNTPLVLRTLESFPAADQTAAVGLLAEGFDMLEEDLEEEQFFATVRKGYWAAAQGSQTRRLAEQLITKLDF
jgi:HEAT repeat protein